jgi:hypothetical protein
MVANGKRRKTRIFRLEQEEGVVEGNDKLHDYIINYHKGLFGKLHRNNFSMVESFNEGIPQITPGENEALVAEFPEEEVCDAIFQMKHNKALGTDGFPVEFYQVFWGLIKDDLIAMFRDFHRGNLPLFCLNFGIITLLHKEKEAKKNSAIPVDLHAQC